MEKSAKESAVDKFLEYCRLRAVYDIKKTARDKLDEEVKELSDQLNAVHGEMYQAEEKYIEYLKNLDIA